MAVTFLLPAWVIAVFTTFAGTLMQTIEILENCVCLSTGYWSFPQESTVTLASDTELDRRSGQHWARAGDTAVIFLPCLTYMGWWCERYLREKCVKRARYLVDHGFPSTQTSAPSSDQRASESSSLHDGERNALISGLHLV